MKGRDKTKERWLLVWRKNKGGWSWSALGAANGGFETPIGPGKCPRLRGSAPAVGAPFPFHVPSAFC